MKLLENLSLILTILIPLIFVILLIIVLLKKRKNNKLKITLLILAIVTFLFNFGVFKYIQNYNDKKEEAKNARLLEKSAKKEKKKEEKVEEPKEEEKEEIKKEEKSKETTNNITTKQEAPKEESQSVVSDSSSTTSKGFKIETINGVTYVDGHIIANKTYPLPSSYIPTGTHESASSSSSSCQSCIIEAGYQAFQSMKNDMANAGHTVWIQSGYRSYNLQKDLYNRYVSSDGKAAADRYSARPGHSEHQTGYAFDVCAQGYPCITSGFNGTAPALWIKDNCYKYGFILRYPEGKEGETGYMHESWHLRYVGTELATKLYNGGNWITMEDYFGITSAYAN